MEKYISLFNLEVKEIIEVPESFSSTVRILRLTNDEKVVLKIPYTKTKLEREYRILKILEDKLPVPIVLNYYVDEEAVGALLLSYIDGEPIKEITLDLAYQMGELLGHLHDIELPSFELVLGEENDWWEAVTIRFNEWLSECKGFLPEDFLNQCRYKFETIVDELPEPDGPAMIHFDYRPGNILVKDNKIVGLIDFESSRGGSRDIDFTKMKLYVWDCYTGSKESFISGYETVRVLPKIETTLPLYLFFNGIGGLAWCVRRQQLAGDFFEENYNQVKDFLL